jgi:hypothetical protein
MVEEYKLESCVTFLRACLSCALSTQVFVTESSLGVSAPE